MTVQMADLKVFTDLGDEIKTLQKHPNPQRSAQLLDWYDQGGFNSLSSTVDGFLRQQAVAPPSPKKSLGTKLKEYFQPKSSPTPTPAAKKVPISFPNTLKVYSVEVPLGGSTLKDTIATQLQIPSKDIVDLSTAPWGGRVDVGLRLHNLTVMDDERKQHPLRVNSMDSVQQVKQNLANFTKIRFPPNQQVLYVGAREMNDSDRLLPMWLAMGEPTITVQKKVM
jgi:hypothetical protein